MMSEFFGSIIPSAIHAMDAAIKRANPHTVMRAFQFAATMAAAIIVMAAARVLRYFKAHDFLLKPRAAFRRPSTSILLTG